MQEEGAEIVFTKLVNQIEELKSRVEKLEKAVGAIATWLTHDTADECKNACKEIYS